MDGNGLEGSSRRWAVSSSPPRRGPVAQLGARLTGSQKVRGSNPLGSTKFLISQSTIWRSMQILEGVLTDYLSASGKP
jgi:hypothetical protein